MRFWLILWLAACWTTLSAAPATAHEGRPVYIEITETGAETFELRWKIPPVIAPGQLPLIRLTGADCVIEAGTQQAQLVGAHLYRCTGDTKAMQIALTYPGVNPVLSTLVMLRAADGTADGTEQSIIAGPDEAIIALPRAETFWAVAVRYTQAGLDHIQGGYDHLLFVLCLILIAGSLRRVLITVTGFTLGHSLTLAMSALGGWSLPPTFVEPLIAFSIVMLAAEVARKSSSSLIYKHPAVVAAGFGLLHGFGFGGALAEIGLPQSLQIQALAFFNVGVEIGQIAFVLAAYGLALLALRLLRMMRSSTQTRLLARIVIYPAGIVAAFWTFERAVGIWA